MSVEAAATFGWERWVGPDGDSVGMHGFGASAPQKDLYEHFGFTPENVAERGKAVVRARRRRGPELRRRRWQLRHR